MSLFDVDSLMPKKK